MGGQYIAPQGFATFMKVALLIVGGLFAITFFVGGGDDRVSKSRAFATTGTVTGNSIGCPRSQVV